MNGAGAALRALAYRGLVASSTDFGFGLRNVYVYELHNLMSMSGARVTRVAFKELKSNYILFWGNPIKYYGYPRW